MRENRIPNCSLKSDKDLRSETKTWKVTKKEGGGS